MRPQILLGMLAHHLFQFGHVARRVGDRVARGPALPGRFHAQLVAAVGRAVEPERQHRRVGALRQFGRRGQRRRRHAEERHEGVLVGEVLVGRISDDAAARQRAQQAAHVLLADHLGEHAAARVVQQRLDAGVVVAPGDDARAGPALRPAGARTVPSAGSARRTAARRAPTPARRARAADLRRPRRRAARRRARTSRGPVPARR